VILPKANARDLAEVPKELRRDLKFVFASKVDDVLGAALVDAAPEKPGAARRPAKDGGRKAPVGKAAARRGA